MSDDELADHRANLRQRLEILDAVVLAFDRRVEVFDTIAASVSADAARARLAELLGVSTIGATAVLDLQARLFAELEANRIREDRDSLRAELND